MSQPLFREDEGSQALRAIQAYLAGANKVLKEETGQSGPRLGLSIQPSLNSQEWWVGTERKQLDRKSLFDHGDTYPTIEKGLVGLANKLLGI